MALVFLDDFISGTFSQISAHKAQFSTPKKRSLYLVGALRQYLVLTKIFYSLLKIRPFKLTFSKHVFVLEGGTPVRCFTGLLER